MDKQYQISPDLKDKLIKYFSAIEQMTEELTTGNVLTAELLKASLQELPYKEKPQHWTGGNVFEQRSTETFILAISP